MYRSSFTFFVSDADEQRELQVNLTELAAPLLPPGLAWRFRTQGMRVQMIVEWPDKETALEWLERKDVKLARFRLDTVMVWKLKGRRSGRRW